MKEPTALELIKWCLKETYRASRLKQWAEDERDAFTELVIESLDAIKEGLLGVVALALSPLIITYRVIYSLLYSPLTMPFRKRETVIKLKEKWEKEL